MVAAGQQQRHQDLIHADAFGADLLDHALHDVGECDDHVESEHAGRALDGVHRAKHGGHGLGVSRRLLQRQEGLFHVPQQFPALGHECVRCGVLGHLRIPSVQSLR